MFSLLSTHQIFFLWKVVFAGEKDPCHLNAFGCDEICSVLADGTPECRCFKGHALLSDKKRCVGKFSFL